MGGGWMGGCVVGWSNLILDLGPPNRHFFSDDGYSVDWKTDEGSSVVRKFHDFVKI